MRVVFLVAALASILCVVLICAFLFVNGIPTMGEIGFLRFLLGTSWKPGQDIYGIFPMIIGSIYVTAGALLTGVPLGLFTAVYMARFCPKPVYKILKPAVELLAGIPSVVYGFLGLKVIVPLVQNLTDTSGKGVFTASLLLGLMILPTIVITAESSLRAVPESYYEGALALGDSPERASFRAMIPAAKSGIMAGVILGLGRAMGEAMAVVMVAGNQPTIPSGLFSGVRTLTANIVLEMGYATDLHRQALIATGVVLFVFILAINLLFSAVKKGDKTS